MASNNYGLPVYTIDLASPPTQRYVQLAKDFAEPLQETAPLLDELIINLCKKKRIASTLSFFSRVLLRRAYHKNITKEMRSIAKAAGVKLRVVLALNSFLDCLLGCTSGAARVLKTDETGRQESNHMMHFRTLDWGMDQLRKLLVVLHYVNSNSAEPNSVIARSITYARFVGVLTGVKRGLSISVNYRPNSDCSTSANTRHRFRVLTGRKESIPSRLRRLLLENHADLDIPRQSHSITFNSPLIDLAAELAREPSSPCYLVLCTPKQVVSIEKDLDGGRIKWSDSFLVQTNHDNRNHVLCCGPGVPKLTRVVSFQPWHFPPAQYFHREDPSQNDRSPESPSRDGPWTEGSRDREDMVRKAWQRHVERHLHSKPREDHGFCVQAISPWHTPAPEALIDGMDQDTLRTVLTTSPVATQLTHFATVIDPRTGTIQWICTDELRFDQD